MSFENFQFQTPVNFNSAQFLNARLFGLSFAQTVTFSNADFNGTTVFMKCNFNDKAEFTFSEFKNKTMFYSNKFQSEIRIDNVKFIENVSFTNNEYHKGASFIFTEFYSETKFASNVFSRFSTFIASTFHETTEFYETKFEDTVSFGHVTFNEIKFNIVKFFKKADFSDAKFRGDLNFQGSTFDDLLSFKNSIFQESLNIPKNSIKKGDNFDFSFVATEKPEKILFHSLNLKPTCFLDCDTRKFKFINVVWEFDDHTIFNDLNSISHLSTPHKILSTTYRFLALNFEEIHHYDDASRFRQLAFEVEWIEKKAKLSKYLSNIPLEAEKLKRRFSGMGKETDEPTPPTTTFGIISESKDMLIHWLYRTTSLYGESWGRAAITLAVIIFLSAVFYSLEYSEFMDGKSGLEFHEAISYSLRAMVLQRPEPFPKNDFAKYVVAFESVFAPLQLALLALAIRRKFMR